MDIIALLKEKQEQHSKCKEFIAGKENEILSVKEEMLRIEGEYRILIDIAKADGKIDEDGNIIGGKTDGNTTEQAEEEKSENN